MVPCRSCKKFHDPLLVCRVAAAQLAAGTMAEPWRAANASRDEISVVESGVKEPARPEKRGVRKVAAVSEVAGVSGKPGRPRLYADAKARRKEYIRGYMRKRRAK